MAIIYRFLDANEHLERLYFSYPGNIDYPSHNDFEQHPLEIENKDSHLLLMKLGEAFELTISEQNESKTIKLSKNNLQELAHGLLQAIGQS